MEQPHEMVIIESRDYSEIFEYINPSTNARITVTGYKCRVEIRPFAGSDILLGVFESTLRYKQINLSGTITVGHIVSLTINNSGLPGGQVVVSYTTATGNTIASIVTGLTNLVNNHASLISASIKATAGVGEVLLTSNLSPATTYGIAVTGSGTITEIATLSDPDFAQGSVNVGTTDGRFTLSMSAAQTNKRPSFDGAHYDFLLVSLSGTTPNFLAGPVKYVKSVTKLP